MLIAFDSKTGNVKRFAKKLDLPTVQITEGLILDDPFILLTYTTGFGAIPPSTARFLKANSHLMIGVSSSGNRNWGSNFGKSADKISEIFNVGILSKFELSGSIFDLEHFHEGVKVKMGFSCLRKIKRQ